MKADEIRLKHIIDSLSRIENFVSNSLKDEKTASAVLYELTIIGEAARVLTDPLKAELVEVPWIDIIGMRNRIVHEYFSIDYDILWNTVEKDIPELKKTIEAYLSK
jgi:uncharacterized protein with HEPN domain